MIEIDGSYLEAGGQILRVSTALAVIKKIPCHIINIRKGRPNPGLATQHLLGLRALAELCNGYLEGDTIGSPEIKFYPGEIKKEKISLTIPTAASVTLILQSLIPPALFAPRPVKISFEGGGTDVPFSPTIDYFNFIFLRNLEKMGAKVEINILRRGYYPEGGAEIMVNVQPSKLESLNLTERGKLKEILIISGASEHLRNKKVSERQLMGAREILKKLKLPIKERVEYYETRSPGSQIFIGAFFENAILGSDRLGKLGVKAENIGRECALQLLEEEKGGGCLDRYLTDQILPYLALTNKKSKVRIPTLSNHAKTNIWTIQHFLEGEFKTEENIVSWIPK